MSCKLYELNRIMRECSNQQTGNTVALSNLLMISFLASFVTYRFKYLSY